jgi:hypothetical protein
MSKNDLTSSEKEYFEYNKEFEIKYNKASEELAEKLTLKKIEKLRQSAKKIRYVEYEH